MTSTDTDSEIIIKAISNETRRNIIRLLVGKTLSYSEMAHLLNFDLKRESGKFNFHLKELVKAELIDNNTTNEEYQLTEKGSEIYYLLIDIEKDREIDPHGLVTALIRLDGRREFNFFLASITMVGALQAVMIGLVGLFGLGSYIGLQLFGAVVTGSALVGLVYSTRYYANVVNDLLGERTALSKILSSVFLLSIQWYFVRGRSRLGYLFATFFTLFGWIIGLIAGLLVIADYGGVENVGRELYALTGAAVVAVIAGLSLLKYLHSKAVEYEATKKAR